VSISGGNWSISKYRRMPPAPAALPQRVVAPVGRRGVEQLLEVAADTADCRLPEVARACLAALGSQLRALKAQILEFDRRIIAWHRSSATSKRLDAIPGVGPALATALVASIADARAFQSRMTRYGHPEIWRRVPVPH
jgi:transposase